MLYCIMVKETLICHKKKKTSKVFPDQTLASKPFHISESRKILIRHRRVLILRSEGTILRV